MRNPIAKANEASSQSNRNAIEGEEHQRDEKESAPINPVSGIAEGEHRCESEGGRIK
jgi:hypothetical protein